MLTERLPKHGIWARAKGAGLSQHDTVAEVVAVRDKARDFRLALLCDGDRIGREGFGCSL
jgi:hypothetical protein